MGRKWFFPLFFFCDTRRVWNGYLGFSKGSPHPPTLWISSRKRALHKSCKFCPLPGLATVGVHLVKWKWPINKHVKEAFFFIKNLKLKLKLKFFYIISLFLLCGDFFFKRKFLPNILLFLKKMAQNRTFLGKKSPCSYTPR
jgi:hypothetical protein